MTKTNASTLTSLYPAPVILFGIDDRGKPKAARFRKDHASLAVKAASQLQLRVLANDSPTIAEIAARLPVGRIHATGRALVPFIRRELYDKLLAVASNGKSHAPAVTASTTSPPSSASSGSSPNLPESWDKIAVGDLVVAQESPEDGWYTAIVIASNGDMFTLRWRDYPRARSIARHRDRLGLLYPGARPATEPEKSPKPIAVTAQNKPSPTLTKVTPQTLPKSWSEINVGHLVLAQSDGPWQDYWEAIPVENNGDGLKLRWRDKKNLAPINRARFDLALIRPEAA